MAGFYANLNGGVFTIDNNAGDTVVDVGVDKEGGGYLDAFDSELEIREMTPR